MSNIQNDKFNDSFLEWWENSWENKSPEQPQGLTINGEFWSNDELHKFANSINNNWQ